MGSEFKRSRPRRTALLPLESDMGYFTTIKPEWIVIFSLITSWLVQLFFFTVLMRRSNRRTSHILGQVEQDRKQILSGLQEQFNEFQKSKNESFDQMRRITGPLALQQPVTPEKSSSQRFGIDKKRQVFGLAGKGMKAADISRRLRIYQGETQLVLSLREYLSGRGNDEAESLQ